MILGNLIPNAIKIVNIHQNLTRKDPIIYLNNKILLFQNGINRLCATHKIANYINTILWIHRFSFTNNFPLKAGFFKI